MTTRAALILGALLAASRTQADAPTLEDARGAFEAGARAFDANDYASALRQFRQAHALAPNDAVRFNIAVCLERLGRFREAAVEYDLAARSDALPPADREEAAAMAHRARERLGALTVTSDVPGGELVVDGVAECSLPCAVTVDPGDHRVSRRGPGSATTEQFVHVERAGRQGVHLTSAPVARDAPASAPPLGAGTPPVGDGDVVATGGPSALFWTGAGLAVGGGGAVLGFGLRTEALATDYRASPSEELRSDGVLSRTLTNVSIGVACVGLALVAVDLLLLQ